MNHVFWQDQLSHLAKDLVMSQDVNSSMLSTSRSSVFVDGTASVLGKIKTMDMGKSVDRPMSTLDVPDTMLRPGRLHQSILVYTDLHICIIISSPGSKG